MFRWWMQPALPFTRRDALQRRRRLTRGHGPGIRGKAEDVQVVEHVGLTVFVCSVPRCVLVCHGGGGAG